MKKILEWDDKPHKNTHTQTNLWELEKLAGNLFQVTEIKDVSKGGNYASVSFTLIFHD